MPELSLPVVPGVRRLHELHVVLQPEQRSIFIGLFKPLAKSDFDDLAREMDACGLAADATCREVPQESLFSLTLDFDGPLPPPPGLNVPERRETLPWASIYLTQRNPGG